MVKRDAVSRRSVTAIGIALVAAALLTWAHGDDGPVRNAIEIVLPLAVGLGVVALGEWLHRTDYSRRAIGTVAAGALAGGALFLALEAWITLIAKPLPGDPGPALFAFALNRSAAGTLGSGLLAVLYVRTRRQNAELAEVTHRLQDRNRALNEQTEQLEAQNQRLNQLAEIVSHDLRNPLNVAAGRAQLARETDDDGHIEAVEDALDRMETIVTDMLALVSHGRLVESKQSIQLGASARAAWSTVETDGVELAVTTDAYVEADEDRVRHVFENLFRNAIEHGGDVSTVTVGETEDGFFVADDGAGVPPEERDRIFDPGFSTSDGGSGLGMVIVKAIVEAHGWTIRVSKSESAGARFDVTTTAGNE